MRLNVRLLSSSPATPESTASSLDVEADASETVSSLKQKVVTLLSLGSEDISGVKLLFRGKTLQDECKLTEVSQLTEGSKLHLVLKREVTSVASQATSVPSSVPSSRSGPTLEEALFNALRKSFKTDEETRGIVQKCKEIFHEKLATLSLDDIERVASHYETNNVLKF